MQRFPLFPDHRSLLPKQIRPHTPAQMPFLVKIGSRPGHPFVMHPVHRKRDSTVGLVVPVRFNRFVRPVHVVFDHIAPPVTPVGRSRVPDVVVRNHNAARLNRERDLTADIAVGLHAVGAAIVEVRAGHNVGRSHVGSYILRVIQEHQPAELVVPNVNVILVPAHPAISRSNRVAIAVEDKVIRPQQAKRRAMDNRVIEHLIKRRRFL